jgi:hypothetical protein
MIRRPMRGTQGRSTRAGWPRRRSAAVEHPCVPRISASALPRFGADPLTKVAGRIRHDEPLGGETPANMCNGCAISGGGAHKLARVSARVRPLVPNGPGHASALRLVLTLQPCSELPLHRASELTPQRALRTLKWTTSRAAAWRAARRTRPLRKRPPTDTCAVGKAHAMQPAGGGPLPATVQWRFQADCSCGKRQALRSSFNGTDKRYATGAAQKCAACPTARRRIPAKGRLLSPCRTTCPGRCSVRLP